MFVGAVSDNFDEHIEQKNFHAKIVIDNTRVSTETKKNQPIPQIIDFTDKNGNNAIQQQIQENYDRIKAKCRQIVISELERLNNNPILVYLLQYFWGRYSVD